jgi:hypothetical protein
MPVVSNIMQIAPTTVGTFLARGNVFRTALSMMSQLQGRVNSLLRQTVLASSSKMGQDVTHQAQGKLETFWRLGYPKRPPFSY